MDKGANEQAISTRSSENAGPLALAVLFVSLFVPLGTLAGYVAVGSPASLLGLSGQRKSSDMPEAEQLARTTELAARLQAKLAGAGGGAEDWLLLARTYRASGNVEQALEVYRQAALREPAAADVLIEYASALVDSKGKRFDEQVDSLVAGALAAQPDNLNALAMAGAAAMQRGERDAAQRHWRRLLDLIPEEGEDRDRAKRLVALASGKAQPQEPQPAKAVRSESGAGAQRALISGTVSVSDALTERLPVGATLFVFARAVDGPSMPVAVVRMTPRSFPVQFTLDDSHSMTEGLKLSSFGKVRLVARISTQGNATRRAGDLEGNVEPVQLGRIDVKLVVDRVNE